MYEPQGAYQLYVDTIQTAGVGDLYQQFERLKEQLQAEGLFDTDRKRPLPGLIRAVGIVTSPTGAALQDMLNIITRRWPLLRIVLSPTPVQGSDAPPKIIAALKRLYQRDDLDAIIVARGGGSIEDLWCFNDEAVARTIAQSPIPIVSGVGHEVDFTIADFVADVRAPTPSAAAELHHTRSSRSTIDHPRNGVRINLAHDRSASQRPIDPRGQRARLATSLAARETGQQSPTS